MGLFDDLASLFLPPAPLCEVCREVGRGDIEMRPGEKYAPSQGMAVSAWICSHENCSHAVMREVDGEVEQYDPPTGDMNPSGATESYWVGADDDPDDGWRSVR